MTDYQRIEKAIKYIKENFKQQPELDDIAKHVCVSPYHFQRMFKEWAGVSPKKFLQYISVEYAKGLLMKQASLADASYETGLSGTSRLHDLFVTIEGMTPGEYKNNGEHLSINYSSATTLFGDIIIASTSKGICHISFMENDHEGVKNLIKLFPKAHFSRKTDMFQQSALQIFTDNWSNLSQIKLHLKGTPFQLKVWETLLKIPLGYLSTYRNIAEKIKAQGASRAVGTAIGSNPIAFLIPCHRVIRTTGIIGEYHWGSERKTAIIGWEASKILGENEYLNMGINYKT